MFEYLMPLLLMRDYDGTLLSETYRAVVAAQRQHGEQKRVPWGVSESAFYAFDLHQNYQYKAFGVPVLGLKRGLGKDVVISPYASVMAMMVDPEGAIRNLYHMKEYGMYGDYGLYEALDLTGKRLPRRQRYRVIQSYMAHHQGMVFLSLFNVLKQNGLQRYFHSIPMVRATELSAPGEDAGPQDLYHRIPGEGRRRQGGQAHPPPCRWRNAPTTPPTPRSPSCSYYPTAGTRPGSPSRGAVIPPWSDQAVNRWRWDPTLEDHGVFVYLYDADD